MAKQKPRARDLKKQRWAGIVAAVLALAMIISLVGVYISQALRSDRVVPPEQEAELQPEDYLAYYQDQIDDLESFLQDNQPTEAVLLELAENYRYLEYIRQMFFDDPEALEIVQARLIEIYLDLIDLEPDKPQYRLELINYYREMGQEGLADEEIQIMIAKLRETPDPLYHLALIGLLKAEGESDPELAEVAASEIGWLKQYFEDRLESAPLDSQDQFYYAVLLGEYLDESDAAEAILTAIIASEAEESKVHQDALSYLGYLRPDLIETEQDPENDGEQPADQ